MPSSETDIGYHPYRQLLVSANEEAADKGVDWQIPVMPDILLLPILPDTSHQICLIC